MDDPSRSKLPLQAPPQSALLARLLRGVALPGGARQAVRVLFYTWLVTAIALAHLGHSFLPRSLARLLQLLLTLVTAPSAALSIQLGAIPQGWALQLVEELDDLYGTLGPIHVAAVQWVAPVLPPRVIQLAVRFTDMLEDAVFPAGIDADDDHHIRMMLPAVPPTTAFTNRYHLPLAYQHQQHFENPLQLPPLPAATAPEQMQPPLLLLPAAPPPMTELVPLREGATPGTGGMVTGQGLGGVREPLGTAVAATAGDAGVQAGAVVAEGRAVSAGRMPVEGTLDGRDSPAVPPPALASPSSPAPPPVPAAALALGPAAAAVAPAATVASPLREINSTGAFRPRAKVTYSEEEESAFTFSGVSGISESDSSEDGGGVGDGNGEMGREEGGGVGVGMGGEGAGMGGVGGGMGGVRGGMGVRGEGVRTEGGQEGGRGVWEREEEEEDPGRVYYARDLNVFSPSHGFAGRGGGGGGGVGGEGDEVRRRVRCNVEIAEEEGKKEEEEEEDLEFASTEEDGGEVEEEGDQEEGEEEMRAYVDLNWRREGEESSENEPVAPGQRVNTTGSRRAVAAAGGAGAGARAGARERAAAIAARRNGKAEEEEEEDEEEDFRSARGQWEGDSARGSASTPRSSTRSQDDGGNCWEKWEGGEESVEREEGEGKGRKERNGWKGEKKKNGRKWRKGGKERKDGMGGKGEG
ncbi:unnamed protein product [Closterium sp. Naga37s-1]|nr:unnamed protein product [Closterium sp. Naga37s-1]